MKLKLYKLPLDLEDISFLREILKIRHDEIRGIIDRLNQAESLSDMLGADATTNLNISHINLIRSELKELDSTDRVMGLRCKIAEGPFVTQEIEV